MATQGPQLALAVDRDEEEERYRTNKVQHTYPLIKYSDMNEDMRTEAVELIIIACERFAYNYELAARVIKEQMDKKFGIYWHVIVGEGFGFRVDYETDHMLYMYLGGNIAIATWKCR